MYLRILKKDLKRKKTMNIILLVFVILASMFVASSVNNIVSVTTSLDSYFDIAGVPDYFVATMKKAGALEFDEMLKDLDSTKSYSSERIIYMPHSNVTHNNNTVEASANSYMLQTTDDCTMNYFLDDNSILTRVEKGKVYVTGNGLKKSGLSVGDTIEISIGSVSGEYVVAGGIKDAVCGSNLMAMTRFIINEEEFERYITNTEILTYYSGSLCYINTNDLQATATAVAELGDSVVFTADRGTIKFTYIFDMIIAGVLLIVSIILIIISFVVLRFTITFTLSEEFREIGVMKAIGIKDIKIRGLYLTKYALLAVVGSAIGLVASFPFGKMLLSIVSKSVIMGNENAVMVNVICVLAVVVIVLLFCFGCTGKVKKYSPIDAIRNGETGERFRKKSVMNLSKSKLGSSAFLALNDIISSPKRFGIITLAFTLCMSLILILSATVSTLKSDSLIPSFGFYKSDVFIAEGDTLMTFMDENGRENLSDYLERMENTLADNGMPATCIQEMSFKLTVKYKDKSNKITAYYGIGTTADLYEYTAGTAPQNSGEIAITRKSAEQLSANIGDTVTINTVDGEKGYIITAFFQSMNTQGEVIRLHHNDEISFLQSNGYIPTQIKFTDNPSRKEITRRIALIKELYPNADNVKSASEWVETNVGVVDMLNSMNKLITAVTVVLIALVTVLMERSFIAREKGEIALLKAVGFRNSKIYAHHTLRFTIVGVASVIISEILAIPLAHLCIDPVFRMMGMELAMEYVLNPFEMFLIYPLIIISATIVSSFFTALFTKSIKSSDTANIE